MARIKSNTFQTIHLPQLDLSDNLLNKTEEINVEPKYSKIIKLPFLIYSFLNRCRSRIFYASLKLYFLLLLQ